MTAFEIPALWDYYQKPKVNDFTVDWERIIPEAGQSNMTIEQVIRKICKVLYDNYGRQKTKQKKEEIIKILKIRGYSIPSASFLKKIAYFK